MMEVIPNEIVREIYLLLPPTDLYQVSFVDKRSLKVVSTVIKKFNAVKEYNRACEEGRILDVIHSNFKPKTLRYVCRSGNGHLIKYFLRKGVEDHNEGLRGLCEGDHPDLFYVMIEPGKTDWYAALQGTCRSGNLLLFNMFLKLCNNCIDGTFELFNAGKYGHDEIIERLLPLMHCDMAYFFDGLCRGGQLDLLKKYFPGGF